MPTLQLPVVDTHPLCFEQQWLRRVVDIPYTRCTHLNGGRLEYSGPSGEVLGWFAEGPRFEPAAAGWFMDAVLRL